MAWNGKKNTGERWLKRVELKQRNSHGENFGNFLWILWMVLEDLAPFKTGEAMASHETEDGCHGFHEILWHPI